MRRVHRTGLIAAAVVGLAALGLIALAWDDAGGDAAGGRGIEFPRAQVVVETAGGALRLDVEVARTPAQRAQGLRFRTSLAPDSGMLFVFETQREARMWMKDTIVSLDMVFIAADGRITRIVTHTTPMSEALIESHGRVGAVLELRAGAAKRLGIKPGDRVKFRELATLP